MNRSLLMTVVGIAIAIPTTGHACSRIGFRPLVRSSTQAHLIATAMPDTVFAGTGSVRYLVAPGHSGPGRDRVIFGQVVSVERIGGLASRGLRQPVAHVVLVPWDYGADCRPTPWTRSAAWVEPGTRGLFTAVLRDSAQWAGGIPTFDVFTPEFEPYPQQIHRQRGMRRDSESVVPMEELLELMELFPDQRLLPDSADAATEALFRWARANPALTRRYPIEDALRSARESVRRQRLRAIESPLTGTWQLTASLSGAPARTFYVRTGRRPTSHFDSTSARQPVDDPTIVPRSYGYFLLAGISRTVDSLPTSCVAAERSDFARYAYIAVLNAPPDSTSARIGTGQLETKLAERAFPDDPDFGGFARAEFDAYYRRSRAGLSPEMPARFTQSQEGTVRVEQVVTLDDGRSLTLSGTRLSPDVLVCR